MSHVDRSARWLYRIFILTVLITFSASLASEEQHVTELGPFMEVFDGTWSKPIPPPSDRPGWKPLNHDVFTSESKESSLWLRGTLEATGAVEPRWLILSPLASKSQVFVDGVPTSEAQKVLVERPSSKPVPYHHLVFELPSYDSTSELVIRLDSDFPISTPVKLVNQKGLVTEIALHTGLSFSLASIILVLTIYNLFLYFSVKAPIYLWYVGLTMCVFLYTLILTNLIAYAGLSLAAFYHLVKPILVLLVLLTIQFVVRILKIWDLSVTLYRGFQVLSAIFCVLLLLTPFISVNDVAFIAASLAILTYLSFIPVAFIRAKAGYKPAIYFLIGWAPVIVAQNMTSLESLGLLKGGQWVMYYTPSAMCWEMVFFSIALASRIKILRDERDCLQAQQIDVSEKARKSLEQSNQIKDDFLNAVSHELRTPLHTIQGRLDLLREAPLNRDQNEAFHQIEYANLRMTRQVGGILDFVDAQANNLLSSPQIFNPRHPFELLEYEFRDSAEAKPLSLMFSIADNLPEQIFMDGIMLEKALYQLIDNAIKFCPADGQVRVEASKSERESTLEVTILDTGPGIPDGQRSKVFQAFTQGEAGLTRHYGGVGLGLPLANSLLEAIGGRMRVLDSSELGTTIELQIPYGEVHLPERDLPQLSDVYQDTQTARILVVEDDPGNRMITRKQLDKMGVVSEGVQNGLEAIEAANKEHWDMIIMDCQMPILDGIEATREIRRSAAYNVETPIIALTANANEAYRLRCLEAGVDEYCTKPLRMAELGKLVNKYAKPHLARRVGEQFDFNNTPSDC